MKPRILIVEDEPSITDTIQYALETDGFETVTLSSGTPVIPLLSKDPIDLIVLDIGLPDINGFELCKKIRKIHTIPIIFLKALKNRWWIKATFWQALSALIWKWTSLIPKSYIKHLRASTIALYPPGYMIW